MSSLYFNPKINNKTAFWTFEKKLASCLGVCLSFGRTCLQTFPALSPHKPTLRVLLHHCGRKFRLCDKTLYCVWRTPVTVCHIKSINPSFRKKCQTFYRVVPL